jgi:DNA-binding HxlR family transcriptional regulator
MSNRKREYQDGCAFAQALDMLGERWALLVVRELIFGPRRFTDLKAALVGIAPNMLSARLSDLEAGGVLCRTELPRPARGQAYALTNWGQELAPVFTVLGRWAARNPRLRFGLPLTVSAAVLSLRAMFRGDLAAGVALEIGLELSGEPFCLRIAAGELTVEPGRSAAPMAGVAGDQNLLLSVLYAGQSWAEAEAAGLTLSGDQRVLETLARLFPMPEAAGT